MSDFKDNGTYNVDNIKKRQFEKLKDTRERMGKRTGPNVLWLLEAEDDLSLIHI